MTQSIEKEKYNTPIKSKGGITPTKNNNFLLVQNLTPKNDKINNYIK